MALEAELDLTLEVLATVANSTLGDILDQPLHMLRHIHSHLQACVSALGSLPGHVCGLPPPICPPLPLALLTRPPLPTAPSSAQSRRQAPGPPPPLAPPPPGGSGQGECPGSDQCLGTTGSPDDGQTPTCTCPFLSQESRGCLEASVTFNLFRLLTRDLKCVADGDLCV